MLKIILLVMSMNVNTMTVEHSSFYTFDSMFSRAVAAKMYVAKQGLVKVKNPDIYNMDYITSCHEIVVKENIDYVSILSIEHRYGMINIDIAAFETKTNICKEMPKVVDYGTFTEYYNCSIQEK